jgi:hypothetical protein
VHKSSSTDAEFQAESTHRGGGAWETRWQDQQLCGGGSRIRTHEGVAPLTVFKTAAFNHSAIPPRGEFYHARGRLQNAVRNPGMTNRAGPAEFLERPEVAVGDEATAFASQAAIVRIRGSIRGHSVRRSTRSSQSDCRASQISGETAKYLLRRSAVSAVRALFPRTIALMRLGGTSISRCYVRKHGELHYLPISLPIFSMASTTIPVPTAIMRISEATRTKRCLDGTGPNCTRTSGGRS